MNNSAVEVLCAFWTDSRFRFGVRVCDNLKGGVPDCVVCGFYPDVDPFDNIDDYLKGEEVIVERCKHFVYSDIYHPEAKSGCYFGGAKCENSEVKGFSACNDCVRWTKK